MKKSKLFRVLCVLLAIAALVPTIAITAGDEYFDVTTNFGTESKTIAPNETIQFTVTVTLDRAVVEEQSCEFTITNNVTAVEAVN